MKLPSRACTHAALGAWFAVLAPTALAADPATEAMQAAYGPYRVALFKTNSNSQAEAQQAMAQAQTAWSKVVAQFGSKPPAPYDRDTAFGTTLTQVADVYASAAQQVSANQLSAAHDTLEKARDLLADVGALRCLTNKLSSEAPAPYKSDPEFVDLLQAVNLSVAGLQTALWAQDAAAAKAAMAKIKAPYSKLFLKFG